MNPELELLKAEMKIIEDEKYKYESADYLRAWADLKELIWAYLQAQKASWETNERNRILKEMGFNGDD